LVSAVYRGDEAKPSVQTCTCVHRTCNVYGVTGDRYGVGQSHPRCDPCYTLVPGLPINFYDATWYATLQNRDKFALKAKPVLELHTIIPVNQLPNACKELVSRNDLSYCGMD